MKNALLSIALLVLLPMYCMADEQGAAAVALLKQQSIEPQKTLNVRSVANLTLPDGWKFLPQPYAGAFMANIHEQGDAKLEGIISTRSMPKKYDYGPVMGTMMDDAIAYRIIPYIAEMVDTTGYLNDKDISDLNKESMLKDFDRILRLNDKTSGIHIRYEATWYAKPAYDASKHRLTWAMTILKKDGSDNDNVVENMFMGHVTMLNRDGSVSFSYVDNDISQPEALKNAWTDLGVLADGLQFVPGHRYEDHQKGDPSSDMALSDMILPSRTSASSFDIGQWLLEHARLFSVSMLGLLALSRFLSSRKK